MPALKLQRPGALRRLRLASRIAPVLGNLGDPSRFMFFATRAKVPSGNVYAAPSSQNYAASQIKFATPEYALTSFRFHWCGFSSTEGGNAPQETQVPGNDTIIDEAFMLVGGTKYPLLFSGAASVTIASATLGAWCDERAVFVPGESDIVVVTKWHTPTTTGNMIPVYRYQAHRGEKAWHAASLAEITALVDADAPPSSGFAANYGTGTQLSVYGPDFMVAKGAWDGRPVALVANDSLYERQEYGPAADARGNLGWLRKWLDRKQGLGRIPFFPIGMPGAAALRELTGSGSTIATRRWDILDQITAFNGGKAPYTVMLNQLGQNDTTTPYSAFLARLVNFTNRVRARYSGIKIVHMTPIGRTGSNAEYKNVADVPYFAVNAFPADATDDSGKWRLRDDIMAKTSGICDAFIDTLSGWQGAAGVGKPPMYDEFPWSTLTAQAGTDGTTPYTTFQVADASVYQPEQQLRVYTADGATLLGSGNVVASISGNTITIQATTLATVYPAGSRLYQSPVVISDGLHLMPIMTKRMSEGLPGLPGVPQSEKVKLVA